MFNNVLYRIKFGINYYVKWTLIEFIGFIFQKSYMNNWKTLCSYLLSNCIIFDDSIYNTFKRTNNKKGFIDLIGSDRLNTLSLEVIKNGDINGFKWILSNFELDEYIKDKCFKKIFEYYDIREFEDMNIQNLYSIGFSYACRKCNMDNLLYLKDKVNNEVINNEVRYATIMKNIEVVKLLLNEQTLKGFINGLKYLSMLKESYDDFVAITNEFKDLIEDLSKIAIITKSIDIIKYLYEIDKVDLTYKNDKLFKKAMEERNIELLNWLCSKNIKYKYVNNQYYIDSYIYKFINGLCDEDMVLEELHISKIHNNIHDICIICHEDQTKFLQLPCGHIMCMRCYLGWYNNNKLRCCYCQRKFKHKFVMYIQFLT